MADERMLFWQLVKTIKKPEYQLRTDEKAILPVDRYVIDDVKLIVMDSGYTNKITAHGVEGIDNGSHFELREGSSEKLQELIQKFGA